MRVPCPTPTERRRGQLAGDEHAADEEDPEDRVPRRDRVADLDPCLADRHRQERTGMICAITS
jgi:hypothetical protein